MGSQCAPRAAQHAAGGEKSRLSTDSQRIGASGFVRIRWPYHAYAPARGVRRLPEVRAKEERVDNLLMVFPHPPGWLSRVGEGGIMHEGGRQAIPYQTPHPAITPRQLRAMYVFRHCLKV